MPLTIGRATSSSATVWSRHRLPCDCVCPFDRSCCPGSMRLHAAGLCMRGLTVLAAKDQLEFRALRLDLHQQALTKIAGGDAYRIELADDGEPASRWAFARSSMACGTARGRMRCCGRPCALRCLRAPRVGSVACRDSRPDLRRRRLRVKLFAQIAFEQLLVAGGQIAILVEVADDVFGSVAHARA